MTDNKKEKTKVMQIAVTQLNQFGPKLAENLLEKLGGKDDWLENFFSSTASDLSEVSGISIDQANKLVNNFQKALSNAEKEYEFTLKNNITTLFFTDDDYPFRMAECSGYPLLLYLRGNADFNDKRYVAIVGTRKATEHGKRLCRKFVEDLSAFDKNIVILSGLAYGIDVTAHKAALDFGLKTYGIIAGGLNHFYPQEHLQIAKQIISEGGGVITESPKDLFSLPHLFAKRNRIIAGMADATVVIESSIKGGSLITAEMALSYGRDVFCFPGRVGERLSAGCNNFIKYNKAGLIENADDFLYFKGWNYNGHGQNISEEYLNLSDNEKLIYELLEKEKTVHKDTIELKFGNLMDINTTLFNMEIKGIIEIIPGNFFSLV